MEKEHKEKITQKKKKKNQKKQDILCGVSASYFNFSAIDFE